MELFLRLIPHIRHIINRDKCFRVLLVYKLHQLLIFIFIYDGDDLTAFFHVIGSDGFIDRCTAVQVVDDKLPQLLFLLRDNADAPFDVIIKNKMIQNDSVKLRSQNTQNYCLLIVDKRRGKCHAHTGKGHGFSKLHVEILIHDLRHDIQSA